MGVVDFSVLGALQKVRSFVAGATPAEVAYDRPPATPRSRSGGPSPENSPPPAATRSGGRRAIALRRQISSPQLLRCRAVRRADDEDDDEPGVQFFTLGNDFLHDFSDTDSVSVSTPNETNRSLTPSPLESPNWIVKQNDSSPISMKNGCFSPDSPGYGTKASLGSDASLQQMNGSVTDSGGEGSKTQYPVDFDANIWCPPPPEDEGDDIESRLFGYDDEDDEVGDSSGFLVSGSFSANKIAGIDEVTNIAQKEGLKTAVLGHFRALVAQLLKAEGVDMGNDDGPQNWLDIVSSLTWQAASYVRPDTKKGGSMDPTDYVKVKCIASGDPRDSNFVRGVVCSKNVKHKRMVSEHRNAKLLILGGALEYHRVPNKLASIGRILEQEKEHMKMIVGKIESRRPNVVLVEKSVSSSAQELFSKDISLVLNVKRTLLDRVSRCTGAQIASSVDSIASARLGRCEVFKVQKVTEFPSAKETHRRSCKTLMFFEGCPWRLGCTVLLRGPCREELKRIKRAVQLAVFAAYHLSLETSFFADEGATLPKFPLRHVVVEPGIRNCTNNNSTTAATIGMPPHGRTSEQDKLSQTAMVNMMFENTSVSPSSLPLNEEGHEFVGACEHKETEYSVDHKNSCEHCVPCATGSCSGHETSLCSLDHDSWMQNQNLQNSAKITSNAHQDEPLAKKCQQVDHWNKKPHDYHSADQHDPNEFSGEYFPGTDNHQSILVSLSSTCIPKGLVCERSHLFRIKFYGSFDKPLGRYLREDLFDQAYCCQSCKEPSESHIRCYTHQHGSLTISVRRLRSRKLPGERDGRIWMWHRCLKCKPKDGVPPATRRIIMSDAAWGLSFGKFLELSFSNHATANRVASCGHSLQRDCLRFYGYGNMVAFFRYSPVDILSVNLPPSILDFNCRSPQEWVKKVAVEIFGKMESLHVEVSEFLHRTEKNIVNEDEPVKDCVQRQIIEMKDLLKMEKNEYEILLLPIMRESNHPMQTSIDILELNRLRRGLLLDAYIWDRRLCHVDSVLKTHGHFSKTNPDNLDILLYTRLKEWKADLLCGDTEVGKSLASPKKSLLSREGHLNDNEYSVGDTNLEICLEGHPVDDAEDLDKVYNKFSGEKKLSIAEPADTLETVERLPSLASIFSDNIDLAWTGSCDLHYDLPQTFTKIDENVSFNLDSPNYSNVVTPVRIHSFNSTLGLRQRERTGLAPASLHISTFKSAEYFGGMTSILKDPMPNIRRACSQRSPGVIEKLNVVLARTPTYISSASNIIDDGARLLLPQTGYEDDVVVAVYDDEPTSIISYAMTSEEYVHQVTHRLNSSLSFSQLPNTKDISSHGLEASSPSQVDHLHSKGTHFKFCFDDDSPISPDKTKFSVICYFAKHFAVLRKKCCPKDIDYIRSLSRCKRWNAQGGKSNVYFAKTMDERFIIKQVTRTELESFVEFAPQYFKYLMESLTSGSPTCLAKIVGLYQVSVKSLKAGKEVRMDLMVMENIFFERKISRVYDLKGSLRSRYTAGDSKVLLDSNLIEALHTKPIFLGSKAKRRLERAIWNDTSFLALADVMDYSLLVGIDEEKKELVIGIIDYLRQYTWDKQLETWVKASGILGGPKNESPTVISPMQYKKRFRKAMSKYFLTVPDQWSS